MNNRQSVRLVIREAKTNQTKNECGSLGIQQKEVFRQLANDIMEEYPVEENSECDEYDYDTDEGPTFTYVDKDIKENDTDDVKENVGDSAWNHIINGLINNNQYLIETINSLNIVPDIVSLQKLYEDKQQNEKWELLNSLNTLLGNKDFGTRCLTTELTQHINCM